MVDQYRCKQNKTNKIEDIVRKEESEFSKDLGELIETLKNQANRPDYKSNVKLLMDKSNISKTTRNRVNSILENVINK